MKTWVSAASRKKVYFDHRWEPNTGIGRFSDMLSKNLNFEKVPLSGKPLRYLTQ